MRSNTSCGDIPFQLMQLRSSRNSRGSLATANSATATAWKEYDKDLRRASGPAFPFYTRESNMIMRKNNASPDIENVQDEIDDDGSTAKPVSPASVNPFDVEKLVASPIYLAANGIKSAHLPIPVRNAPGTQVWFRVHPDPTFARVFNMLTWVKDGETYLAAPAVAAEYPSEFKQMMLYVCMTSLGALFIWSVAMPTENSSGHWLSSKHEAAEVARGRSIRIRSNKETESWQFSFMEDPIPEVEPDWPNESYASLLDRAFVKTNQYIGSHDHEVMRSLRGLPLC
jgi:hypothetical protein